MLEIPVIVAALLVIPSILIEGAAATPFWLNVAIALNWLIWVVFVIDFVVMFTLVRDRKNYMKTGWLDLFIVITSFPILTTFGVTRLMRLWRIGPALRLVRLVRLAAVLTRGGQAVRGIFRRKGLGYIVGIMVLIALGFGVMLAIVEPSIGNAWDGIWWAFVTATTVGYGDISPESPGGRLVAMLLMLIGIGLVGVFTGLVASYFVGEDEEAMASDITRLHDRLDAIEAALGITTDPE